MRILIPTREWFVAEGQMTDRGYPRGWNSSGEMDYLYGTRQEATPFGSGAMVGSWMLAEDQFVRIEDIQPPVHIERPPAVGDWIYIPTKEWMRANVPFNGPTSDYDDLPDRWVPEMVGLFGTFRKINEYYGDTLSGRYRLQVVLNGHDYYLRDGQFIHLDTNRNS